MVAYGESGVELGTENNSPLARRVIHWVAMVKGLEGSNRSLRFPMSRTWHRHQYQVRSCGKAHLSRVYRR